MNLMIFAGKENEEELNGVFVLFLNSKYHVYTEGNKEPV